MEEREEKRGAAETQAAAGAQNRQVTGAQSSQAAEVLMQSKDREQLSLDAVKEMVQAPQRPLTQRQESLRREAETAPVPMGLDSTVIDDGHIESLGENITPEALYGALVLRAGKYLPGEDIEMIHRAYAFASEAHRDQKRKSGEPYIIHPLYVAIILADMEMDRETICAGLLHDVVEDTGVTREQVEKLFGPEVALLVDGVTKLKKIHFARDYKSLTEEKQDMQAENLRKMFLAMSEDIRVILLKLADRLHNMRTLAHMPAQKQERIARETLEIYSPIADRLGIGKIKVELDDLAFRYLHPDLYFDLVEKVEDRKEKMQKYIPEIAAEVREQMNRAGIKCQVDGRIKHYYSIYLKMKRQKSGLDEIFDLFAIRIYVDTIPQCYEALGQIHALYLPLPGRIKDYIAMPKSSTYRSLHTTVMGRNGQPFEVQIRTYEMHEEAEYGYAAHWRYKQSSNGKKNGGGTTEEDNQQLNWLKRILEYQQEESDNGAYLSSVKADLHLYRENVFIFTPRGEVRKMPAGSTAIDFAYAVHTNVGNRMMGARVNGKLVNRDYVLQNGDMVEIIKDPNPAKGPSLDWLKIAHNPSTKNKINAWFRKNQKTENVEHGRELILQYCKIHGIDPTQILKKEFMEGTLQKYGFRDWEALLAAVGHGGLKEGQIVNRLLYLLEEQKKKERSEEEILRDLETSGAIHIVPSGGGIRVLGQDDVMVHLSHCCGPIPGDDIVGFITRGRGISVHRKGCVNVRKMAEQDPERRMPLQWNVNPDSDALFETTINIYSNNRVGLLNDVSRIFEEKGIDIKGVRTRTSNQGIATMTMSMWIRDIHQLEEVVRRIRQIRSVLDVTRIGGEKK